MRQYLRKARVTFNDGALVVNPGGVNTHELKVGFDVSKGISGSPNTARISVWNLNEGHRNAVGKELDKIQLEAGYLPPEGGGNVGIIFKGRIRDVEHEMDSSGNIITHVSCGDGDTAYRRATISRSFPTGTPVSEVVEELYQQMEAEGVDRGEWKFPDDLPEFKRPYASCGSCVRELDMLGRSHGFYWSLQNETLEIIPSDGYLAGMVLLTPETGLVGVPTITDNGVKASALLNPEIRPNRRIRIESKVLEMNAADGEYRVSQTDFRGDNHDGDFVVDVHGEAVTGGDKVDEGKRP